MQDLPKAATSVEQDVKEIISIISLDEETNVDGVPMREIGGLDKAMKTMRGHLELN